jgi:hypothetical protein
MKQSKPQNRQGATAVEFALTAPLVFMLLFGSLELGHANMMYHTAEAAAYEGARKGIIPGATAADCVAAANDLLAITRTRGATVTVVPSTLTSSDEKLTVQIEIPYSRNSITVPFFTRSLTIRRECTLSRERSN